MKVEHIVERLESLAAWLTPGVTPPKGPQPINIHLLAREAASALRMLNAESEINGQSSMLHPIRRRSSASAAQWNADWAHWCVYDVSNKAIIFATSEGRARAVSEANKLIHTHRNICLRPLMVIEGALPGAVDYFPAEKLAA